MEEKKSRLRTIVFSEMIVLMQHENVFSLHRVTPVAGLRVMPYLAHLLRHIHDRSSSHQPLSLLWFLTFPLKAMLN